MVICGCQRCHLLGCYNFFAKRDIAGFGVLSYCLESLVILNH